MIHARKILSENENKYKDPILEGIRQILNLKNLKSIPINLIEEVRIGTTIATNALLTRSGTKTALFITEGYKDALKIGNQTRPNIFARNIITPDTIYYKSYEITERISSNGKILTRQKQFASHHLDIGKNFSVNLLRFHSIDDYLLFLWNLLHDPPLNPVPLLKARPKADQFLHLLIFPIYSIFIYFLLNVYILRNILY